MILKLFTALNAKANNILSRLNTKDVKQTESRDVQSSLVCYHMVKNKSLD